MSATITVEGHAMQSRTLPDGGAFVAICQCGWIGPVVPMFHEAKAADAKAAARAHLAEAVKAGAAS